MPIPNAFSLDNVILNIAVTGYAGSGKTSLVNAMRGVWNGDPGAAHTFYIEATKEPTMYPHPTMPNVKLWDLPGIGTPEFKAKDYLQKVRFDRYDFFIIVSSVRFVENDLMLATEIQRRRKLFYFVRSKIDLDVQAEQRRPNANVPQRLDDIRRECERHLRNIRRPKVFLMSSFELEHYDFQELLQTLENDLPEHKRNALLLSLPVYSSEMLRRKVAMFQNLAWAASAASAAAAVVPVPGLSVACDVAILVCFLMKCFCAFGLDENSLNNLSERTNTSVGDLRAVMRSPFSSGITERLIVRMLASGAFSCAMAVEYAFSFIPGVGSLIAGGISFGTTYCLLSKGIEEMAADARAVLRVAGLA